LLRQGKGTTYEGGMREPTIFWWPGKIAPGVQMEMGTTMDILPTFCALAGATPPQDRVLDGYDLSPLLLGSTEKGPRDTVFYWREEKLFAVRQGPWKAHFITEGCYGIGPKREVHETPELYELEQDPSEKYNIASLHSDLVARLKAVAERHLATIVPVPNQLEKRSSAAKR